MISSPNAARTGASGLPIICDYIDTTYSPVEAPYPEVNTFLLGAGLVVTRERSGRLMYRPPKGMGNGVVAIDHRAGFARFSASGGICSVFRGQGVWEEYLSLLGTSPHKVTRVDAALDLPIDAADVIPSLCARHPTGKANLSRKALAISRLVSVRDDGRESGTFYIGRHAKAARFTARVYDKSLEALQVRGEVLPTTTRFEVTACKDSGATLRDAAQPEALFWHIAAPALLQRPEGVPMWAKNQDLGWVSPPRTFNAAEVLQRRIESSAELDALLQVADSMGASGRAYMLHLLTRRLNAQSSSEGLSEAV
ncbi:hypothetical protein PAGU2196_53500 [Pseudomonas sp. PAGU 2196]|uniref:hypothetical protein n=1 Tax=Pseudomonas sp. PAGU 2196 TaxID=2793997 RepID=UPI001EDFD31A|nr:hypothetical protein [Pseudomonas sp. PAGU 2196]GHS84516.1 hypothetical protein PAGU2196_53500 [Pseudomonas sp. PAGU 2196]